MLAATSQNAHASIDSLRVETIEGKKFIVHKVEPKETLYALSKRYQVSVSDIQNNNEQEKDGFAIDQIGRILYIPLKESVQTEKAPPLKKHTVKSGETLYSLSKQYGVSMSDLMKWNNLENDQLSLGQELVIGEGATAGTVSTGNNNAVKTGGNQVIHRVDMGETIYALSRKYKVTEEQIKEWNNLDSNELAVGQELVVGKGSAGNVKNQEKNSYAEPTLQRFYIAKKGETYADVAENYNLKLSELESWNVFEEPFAGGEEIKIVKPENMTAKQSRDDINNQSTSSMKGKVHTVASGETLFSIAKTYDTDYQELRKWNNLSSYSISIGQKLYVTNPDAFQVSDKVKEEVATQKEEKPQITEAEPVFESTKQDTKAYFTVEEEDIPKIEKIVDKGIAEVIDGSDNTDKYLALHRTAKIGTIMQVRNDLNDQIVFVRVLGKLPNTGVDDKVIIRISKKAFQRLGGVDYKFPVEISYLPLND